MDSKRFQALVTKIRRDLTCDQIIDLEAVIREAASTKKAEMAIARRTEKVVNERACPHCGNIGAHKHGRDKNGRQRFKCKGCSKTYNALTGTHLARAKKMHLWAPTSASSTNTPLSRLSSARVSACLA